MTTPERLVAEAFSSEPVIEAARNLPPFPVPYDHLAAVPGWVIWIGHPPVPGELPIAPWPHELLYGDPHTTLAAAALVVADYAVRRGAANSVQWRTLIERESPITLVLPGDVHRTLQRPLGILTNVGVPVIARIETSQSLQEQSLPARMRAEAHSAPIQRNHDPAMTFQIFNVVETIGGNPLSSFIVHSEGERDGVHVTGEFSPRFGLEVGLRSHAIGIAETEDIELEVARMPSYLDGVSSQFHRSLVGDWVAVGAAADTGGDR